MVHGMRLIEIHEQQTEEIEGGRAMTKGSSTRQRVAQGQTGKPDSGTEIRQANRPTKRMPAIPAAEALSFLKDMKGALTWTTREMVDALNISQPEANQVIAILQLQGYVKPALDHQGWVTTPAGEVVCRGRSPRFHLARVNEALAVLEDRLKSINQDRRAEFQIADAVAYGDFLTRRQRVQAANVGVRVLARKRQAGQRNSSAEVLAFLKQLRGQSALLELQPYQSWMSDRSHRRLV
jgi:hypothetical protein